MTCTVTIFIDSTVNKVRRSISLTRALFDSEVVAADFGNAYPRTWYYPAGTRNGTWHQNPNCHTLRRVSEQQRLTLAVAVKTAARLCFFCGEFSPDSDEGVLLTHLRGLTRMRVRVGATADLLLEHTAHLDDLAACLDLHAATEEHLTYLDDITRTHPELALLGAWVERTRTIIDNALRQIQTWLATYPQAAENYAYACAGAPTSSLGADLGGDWTILTHVAEPGAHDVENDGRREDARTPVLRIEREFYTTGTRYEGRGLLLGSPPPITLPRPGVSFTGGGYVVRLVPRIVSDALDRTPGPLSKDGLNAIPLPDGYPSRLDDFTAAHIAQVTAGVYPQMILQFVAEGALPADAVAIAAGILAPAPVTVTC